MVRRIGLDCYLYCYFIGGEWILGDKMKLTKKVMKQYGIEIESETIDGLWIDRPYQLHTIKSEQLKVNWSGTGVMWLQKAKRELIQIIES